MQKIITLTVNGQELVFNVDTPAYNRYINELLPTNKVAPAENFLRRTVAADSKDALKLLLEQPGAAIQMAMIVTDDFMPELEIAVGK